METIRVALSDLNGVARGKRLPAAASDKVAEGDVRMPMSICNLDIFGRDIEGSPLVFATGDADGQLRPTDRGPVPMPWLPRAELLHPMMMWKDGAPFAGDARAALVGVVKRFRARGLHPVCATEMEFTLFDGEADPPKPPRDPVTGRRLRHADITGLDALDRFAAFFDDLYDGADAMGVPAQAAISEAGTAQFEVDLSHADALRAADDAWLFKMLVKGTARQHGMAATFLAKPNAEDAGNGMHVHCSVLDESGANIFDCGAAEGTPALRHAVMGCLSAMAECTLIFAPHAGSYARLVPGAHAPTGVGWAYDNRTAAIRVPDSAPAARRIEHRVAGGDANPYLLLAAVLGAMLDGLERQVLPPEPITGNAYSHDLPQIPSDWSAALGRFEQGTLPARIFTPMLIDNLARTKRQEMAATEGLDHAALTRMYLNRV